MDINILRDKARTSVGPVTTLLHRGGAGSAIYGRPVLAWLLTLAMIANSVSLFAEPSPAIAPASTTQAPSMIIFGPARTYTWQGYSSSQFNLPDDAIGPYTLTVTRTGTLCLANVTLNGQTLSDLGCDSMPYPKVYSVTLNATNSLQISVNGTPSSSNYVTATITGYQATLQAPSVTSAAQGQTTNVTLMGNSTHWVAGQTTASFGPGISVGGAPYGDFGPITVIDDHTATAQIAVSLSAALAANNVAVKVPRPNNNGNEIVTSYSSFQVIPGSPTGLASTTVSLFAGSSSGIYGYLDGSGTQAWFSGPSGLAVTPNETLYVADTYNNCIRVIQNQYVSTLAGNGYGNTGFVDDVGTNAFFNRPQGVAVDSSGVVYVADTNNHAVRRITQDGTVTTLAGNGYPGFYNGTGQSASFNAPKGIVVNSLGHLYVADTGNAAVRRVLPDGTVNTIAGDGTVGSNDSPNARFNGLTGIGIDNDQIYIYLTDKGNHRIRRLDPTNSVITVTGAERGYADGTATQARFADPTALGIDGAGHLLIADNTNSLIREVDTIKALNGEPNAVFTLAGTGAQGFVNGAGNVAKFSNVGGIVVAQSSVVYIAETGNNVIRKILLPPVISSFNPSQVQPGTSIVINGNRFDGRGPSYNTVRFAKSGGGTTIATVTAATRASLTVTIPADAVTGPVSVQTQGGTGTSLSNFTVGTPPPTIADFTPKIGSVGTSVTLTGNALKVGTITPSVTFTGSGGSRVTASVTSSTPTQVVAVVPNGAVTGIIQLTTSAGTASTSASFVMQASQDYTLTMTPSTTTAVQGSQAVYLVNATSPQPTFTQLISLSATGLPSGVIANFQPTQITAGAAATLTLVLPGGLAPSTYSFTVNGTAKVDGTNLNKTASANLSVLAAGQTTLSGQVLAHDKQPVIGATVSLDGQTATTNSAGMFLLSGVTAGNARPLMVDGRTASAPGRTYPVITEPADVVAGQANVVPYIFYLPVIDTQYEVTVVPTQTTVVTNPRVPNLQMTVPANANLRNRDGSPVTLTSITPVPLDRTPAPLPANVTTGMVYTSQPGGAIANVAMPVVYPNLGGAAPGTVMELYSFNHDTVQWYVYGYGTVSADGRTITPNINPGTGQPYGLPDFSWHFPRNATPSGDPNDSDCGNRGNNPVDYSSGLKIEKMTDVAYGGRRGVVALTRTYTTDLAVRCPNCPFGRGTTHNYAIRLSGTWQTGGAGRVIFPEQFTGRLFNYLRTDPDGSLVFSTTATSRHLRDTVKKLTNGTFEYHTAEDAVLRFDAAGKLTALVDRNGNTTTLTYTGNNLTQVTDPVGRFLTLQYNGANRISSVTDPLGRVTQYAYDPITGSVSDVTDPLNQVTHYNYNTFSNLLTSIRDKRGNTMKALEYDPAGRVSKQTFADGGYETYAYALSGQVVTETTITDSLGRKDVKRFNAAGYLIEEVDALGQKSVIERDIATNLPLSVSGPCGCKEVSRTYDARGNVLSETNRLGQTAYMEYEPVHNFLTKFTDRRGNITTLTYDAKGNWKTVTNALGQTTAFAYDQYGLLINAMDALGHTRLIEYDAQGNLTALVDALGNRTTFQYDAIGRRIGVMDALGRHTSTAYDALDRVTTFTDTNNAVTTYGYDAEDNVTSVLDGLGRVWRAAYDAKGRVSTQSDPLNRITRYDYNTDDELLRLTSPSGRMVRYTYDARGQQATMIDPLGAVMSFTYDNYGQVTTITDQRNNITTITYDELYRPLTSRDPLGRLSALSYDAQGNISSMVDRLGRQLSVTYDTLNRPQQINYPDAVATLTYDAAGRRTRIDDSQSGFALWNYDDADRVLSETTNNGTVSYTYNQANQRLTMTPSNRPVVNYGYDMAGRLSTITQGTDTFTYNYDLLSRRTGLQRPNGVTTTYSYDQVNRLTRLLHTNAASATLEDFNYSYNQDDEITNITSLASANPLPPAKTVTTADATNRIAQVGTVSYGYDNEGQTTTRTDGAGTTNFTWDARGRLTTAAPPSGQAVNYTYDALGRRASRTASGQTTTFLYDGADVVLDRKGTTNVDYVNGSRIDEHLSQRTNSGSALYFTQDHLGSTSALTNSSGGLIEQQSYEAFGANNGSTQTRYGYTGRERDETTGLLYYRERWYDAHQGRFLTEDPIGYEGGANFYSYVSNDPINLIDPFGLSWQTFAGGFVTSLLLGFIIGAGLAIIGGIPAIVIGGILLGIGVYSLGNTISRWDQLCQDDKDAFWGSLLGGLLGGWAGGVWGGGIGSQTTGPSLRSLVNDAASVLKQGSRYKSTAVGRYEDGSLGIASSDPIVPRVQKIWAEKNNVRVVDGLGHAEETLINGATSKTGPLKRVEVDSPHGRNPQSPNGKICLDCEQLIRDNSVKTDSQFSGRRSPRRK